MGNPVNRVDLFVEGTDFYLGSTKAALKDGWCDFPRLGRQQVREHVGSSYEMGSIWYLTEQVSPRELRSFEKHERQKLWLGVLGREVTRLIVGDRFKSETAAISWLDKAPLAPNAIVIFRDHERQGPLISFLDRRYPNQQAMVLMPPDFEIEDFGRRDVKPFSHDDLAAAHLGHEDVWREYRKSRARRDKVREWTAAALINLRTRLTERLGDKGPLDPEGWKNWANKDPEILERTKERVARFLGSANEYRSLASDSSCITFIARSNIHDVAAEIAKERWGPAPKNKPSISSGQDLIDYAGSVYPKIEICKGAKRQIRDLRGNERYFNWVLEALASANREMLAWKGGRFQHDKLPGPPTPESEPTMNAYGERRRFRTLSGESLLFEYHMKCRAENQRIHYRVDEARRLLMIGYVGPHLPTVTNRT